MNTTVRSKAFAAAQSAGIDLSLVEANLGLSVAERWKQHDAALDLALKLQDARERHDAKFQRAIKKTG